MPMGDEIYKDEMEKWRNSTAALVSVMKNEMDHIKDECSRGYTRCESRLDGLTARVNDGFTTRVFKLENDLTRYDLLLAHVTQRLDRLDDVGRANRAWMRNIAATLFCLLIGGFVANYLAGNTKVATLQQELQQISQQVRELRPSRIPP